MQKITKSEKNTNVALFLPFIKETYFDKSIQRRQVWKKYNKEGYKLALLSSKVVNPIVLADIMSCKYFAKENGINEDFIYFDELLKKGYKYISIDGGNRSEYLKSLFTGVNIMELTGELKEIYDSEIFYIIFNNLSKKDIHELAFNTNMGTPWNEQEKRNCIQGPVSDFIRDVSEKMKGISEVISGIDITRLGDDELYAYFLSYHQTHSKDIVKKTLSSLYKNSYINNEKEFMNTIELWGKVISYLGQKSSKIKKSFSFNLFVFLLELSRQNKMVMKKDVLKEFSDKYEMLECERISQSMDMTIKRCEWAEKNRNMAKHIKEKYEKIYSDFQNHLDTYFIKLDEKRLYTENDKIVKYIETNGVVKTLDGGEETPTLLQAINSSVYHADHSEIPYSKGGPTTLENMQLLKKSDNLKKSNKINPLQ